LQHHVVIQAPDLEGVLARPYAGQHRVQHTLILDHGLVPVALRLPGAGVRCRRKAVRQHLHRAVVERDADALRAAAGGVERRDQNKADTQVARARHR